MYMPPVVYYFTSIRTEITTFGFSNGYRYTRSYCLTNVHASDDKLCYGCRKPVVLEVVIGPVVVVGYILFGLDE